MLGAGCLVLAVVDVAPVHMHPVMCVSTADEINQAAPEGVEPAVHLSGESTTVVAALRTGDRIPAKAAKRRLLAKMI